MHPGRRSGTPRVFRTAYPDDCYVGTSFWAFKSECVSRSNGKKDAELVRLARRRRTCLRTPDNEGEGDKVDDEIARVRGERSSTFLAQE